MSTLINCIRNHWLKPLIPFTALGAAYNGFTGVFNPFVTLWLKESGLDLATISLLLALQPISRLFAPYLWGLASDSSGARIMVIKVAAFSALLFSFGFWIDNIWLPILGIFFFLFYSTTTAIIPLNEAAMASWLSHKGVFDFRSFGRSRLVSSVAFLAAVYSAGYLFSMQGIALFPYAVSTMLFLMACITIAMPNKLVSGKCDSVDFPITTILKQPRVRLFLLSTFFHLLSLTGTNVYLSLYLDSLGYGKTFIGTAWAASIIMEVLWFMNQGRLFGQLSVSAWLVFCSIAAFLRLGIMAMLGGLWPFLLVAQALHAITYAAHHSACTALLNDFFPSVTRARGQAIYTVVAFGIAGAVGISCGGWLGMQFKLQSIFYFGMFASACAIITASFQFKSFCTKNAIDHD